MLLLLACAAPPVSLAAETSDAAEPPVPIDGRELFLRSWEPGDLRAAGGDGLGPVFNDVSCVACHALGGPGGAGGNDHNVRLTSVSGEVRHRSLPESPLLGLVGTGGTFFVSAVERNTPALFGAGLLDAVPDDVLLAVVSDPSYPEVTGRVARAADGRVGRFGWKGQIADLPTFVRKACANELGLDVPGEAQPGPAPYGNDLDDAQVDALVAYVAALPPPDETAHPGRATFDAVGCEGCHREVVGAVAGAYTDLLLHDLGAELADGASGYGVRSVARVRNPDGPALPGEWRTPPLWGVRDSGPYLHDGRAGTLDAAIRAHAGEADAARGRYLRLPLAEQQALQSFLRALVAPGAA
jgi:CxxC motif-containing protein (DUF1111 family)